MLAEANTLERATRIQVFISAFLEELVEKGYENWKASPSISPI